jgi:uncharacterized membrane protein
VLVIGSTALSGGSGYLVTWLVAAQVSTADYTIFAVFWSALFLVLGTLGGVQQEFARATFPLDESAHDSGVARASHFALLIVVVVALLLAASAPFWGVRLLGDAAQVGVIALIAGACGYVLVATSCGVMYGIAAWLPLAAMIGLDGALRLVLVGVALMVGGSVELLMVAVVLPLLVTLAIVVPVVAARLQRSRLDVGYRRLSGNTVRTVVAAAATATIISGFPVLLRASDPDAPAAIIGPLILVLTLTRAPLVIPMMALQSYFVVRFQASPDRVLRNVSVTVTLVVSAAGALALILGFVGPTLFAALFGAAYSLDGFVIAGLVASSGLVGALTVTGSALLARSRHSAVTTGWLVAAVVLLAVLWLPLPLVERALVALAAGPLAGLLVHVAALLRSSSRRSVVAGL